MRVASLQGTLLGAGDPALTEDPRFERIPLDDTSFVDVCRGWLEGGDTLLEDLVHSVRWRQGRRPMWDRMVDDPRLTRWYHRDLEAPAPVLGVAHAALEDRYGVALHGPGLNYYRDGNDSVAYHRDRELRDTSDTIVAILTLGAARPFHVRPLGGGRSFDLRPGSGDLLVMGGRTQADWEHGVPKVAACGPRISASWRWSPTFAGRTPVTGY